MTPHEIRSELTVARHAAGRANDAAVILVGAVSALSCIAAVPVALAIVVHQEWWWLTGPVGAEVAAVIAAMAIMRRADLRHEQRCHELGVTV